MPLLDGYIAFMLVATALVLMMTVPALALFYGGMVRSKSVLNMMMLSFVAFVITAIVFVLWGWSEGGWWDPAVVNGAGLNTGNLNGKLIASPFYMFGLKHEIPGNFVFVMFQMTFAAITAALISGSIADRVKISSWAIFVPFWLTLVYFPIAHNVWGGGWLFSHFPNLDYAGGTVVHINAGMAGLVLAIIIGKRVGWPKDVGKPHNVTLTMIGAGLLWFGWYGFNVGSIVQGVACTPATVKTGCDKSYFGFLDASGTFTPGTQFPSEMAVTFLNTTVATAAACIAWLLVERLIHKKFTSLGAASGIVAGLVAITPSCGSVSTMGAIAVGVLAGAICAVAINFKYKVGLDDSLDVVGVHLTGGIVGALSIGFLGTRTSPQGLDGFFPDKANGLFYGGDWELLGHQAAGVLFTIVWCGVFTAIIGLIIKYTIKWRVTPEEEVEGIDIVEHGESAYDLDNRSGGILTTGVLGSHTKEGALA